MKKTIMFFSLIGSISLLGGCTSEDSPEIDEPINIELTRSEANAVNAVNDFAFDLMRASESRFGEETPNYIMSPQSAAWCLAMVANGATEGSQTLQEITDVLHLGPDATLQDVNEYCSKLIEGITTKSKNASFTVANAVYYKEFIGIKRDYVNALKTFFESEEIPNHTNGMIDSWVSDRTGGLIQNFGTKNNLEKLAFGVINTTLFNAKWLSNFNKDKSERTVFRNADGTESKVPMICCSSASEDVSSDEVCHLLKVRVENQSFAFYFVIPSENHNIQDVLAHLDGDTWKNLVNTKSPEDLIVKFPELDMSTDLDFKYVIQDMGVKKIFSTDNELTNIAKIKTIMTQFDQSNVLKLDEKGVVASSSTNLGGLPLTYVPGEFLMNEPFYFFIAEESTGAILYAGKVSQL